MASYSVTFVDPAESINRCAYINCDAPLSRMSYCAKHAEKYDAVHKRFLERAKDDRPAVTDLEYIYVIGSDQFDPVKIGISSAPINRCASLQIGNPFPLRIMQAYLLSKNESTFLEWNIHVVLKGMGFGVSGEWFDLTADEAMAVIQKCAQNLQITIRTPFDVLAQRCGQELGYGVDVYEQSAFYDRVALVRKRIVG